MTNPTDGAMPPLPEPSFEYPSLCRFNDNEMESYAKAYAAPLVARVAELEAAIVKLKNIDNDGLYREEISFEGSGRYAVDIDSVHELSRIIDAALTSNKEQQP